MGNFESSDNVTDTDVEYNKLNNLAVELVKQAYDTSCQLDVKNLEYARKLSETLSVDQLIRVALHLSQRTYTGFYSILFNRALRENFSEIHEELKSFESQDYFPELYNNVNLTPSEKSELEERYIQEYNALTEAYREASKFKNPKFFRHCDDLNIPDDEMDDLYSQAYNRISIIKNLESHQSFQNTSRPTFSSPINNQIITDNSLEVSISYCIPLKDLLLAITEDQKNPLTNTPLPSSIIERVKRNFPTELKLIGYR
jgi:hypothetical protein